MSNESGIMDEVTIVESTPAPPERVLEEAPDQIAGHEKRIWLLRDEIQQAVDRAARRKLELQGEVANDASLTNETKRKAALEERLTTDQAYAKHVVRARDLEHAVRVLEIGRDTWINRQRNARVLLLARVPDREGGDAQ